MTMIRTITDLSNAWARRNTESEKLGARPYVAGPALERYLATFQELKTARTHDEREKLFRRIPAYEFHLSNIDKSFSPQQRTSFAQQDRAQNPRIKLTADEKTMRNVVWDLVTRPDNNEKIAKTLWPLLFKELDSLQLSPTLIIGRAEPHHQSYLYGEGRCRRSITERRFANILSTIRRELRTI